MKIQCENCGIGHELDPPAWVVSSGRPFRFRCSSCGHSQMVSPAPKPAAPPPTPAPPTPAPPMPTVAAAPVPTPAPVQREARPPTSSPEPAAGTEPQPVYLKQEGKVYLVRDWATVQRWIMERRIARDDLVSEGGVRWEPIGSRPDLGSFFAAVEQLEASETAPALPASPEQLPFDPSQSQPPTTVDELATSAGASRFARLDDDTEGVSFGLPLLPTDEVDVDGGHEEERTESYPDVPPLRRGQVSQTEVTETHRYNEPSPLAVLEAEPVLRRSASPTLSPMEASPPAMLSYTPPPAPEAAAPGIRPSEMPTLISMPSPQIEFPVGPRPGPTAPPQPSQPPKITAVRIERPREEPKLAPKQITPTPVVVKPPVSPTSLPPGGPDDDDAFGGFSGEHTGEHTDEVEYVNASPWPRYVAAAAVVLFGGIVVVAIMGFAGHAVWKSTRTEDTPPPLAQVLPTPPPPVTAPVDTDTDTDTPAADTDALDTDVAADTDVPAAPVVTNTPPPVPVPVATTQPSGTTVTPVDASKPPPVAVPKPAPALTGSVASLCKKGWAATDKNDLTAAEAAFEKALQQDSSNAEANEGLAYVEFEKNDNDNAKSHLCRAKSNAGVDQDLSREIDGMMRKHDITCD